MYHDDTQYTQSRSLALTWIQQLQDSLPSIVQDVSQKLGVEGVQHEFLTLGSFNTCYRLKGLHSIIRFAIMGKSVFRFEKTNDECRVMTYLSQFTSILVPKLLGAESCHLGPYMVIAFVDGTPLSNRLKALPPDDEDEDQEPIILQPNIDTGLLSRAYRRMASILIKLSKCRFSKIGAIGRDASGNWCVTKRAVTLNMNQLVSCGNFPPKELPQQPFPTANAYFTALAEMHITHLRTQRNDAVDDEEDCRRKYVARHLFLDIARNFSTEHNAGPFPLYCDDLRPTNVIVDSGLNTNGVIDWEYCYAAPAEFTYCPPSWLLLAHPDDWADGDLGDFLEHYKPRFNLFLETLQSEEDNRIQHGKLKEEQRLSPKMAESLDNGTFWFCLAATSSFGFDDIYWKFIDPLYYGEFTTLEDRIRLLSFQQQEGLDVFVKMKMEQAAEGGLDEHTTPHERLTA